MMRSSFGMGTRKGQITVINLFVLFITFFIYCIIIPTLNDQITPVVAYFQANPNPVSGAEIFLLYAIPFLTLFFIVLTGINYAIPQREGYGPR